MFSSHEEFHSLLNRFHVHFCVEQHLLYLRLPPVLYLRLAVLVRCYCCEQSGDQDNSYDDNINIENQ